MGCFPGCVEYRKRRNLLSTAAFIFAALLTLRPSLLLGAAPADKDWNLPTKTWYQGPVRYLISSEEEKAYRALTTDADRQKFIEDFWARRDEDPATPVNEFQLRYAKRVEEADSLFQDAPYPGWKTDRGKFYLLLGGPDEIRQGQIFTVTGKDIPYLIWIYHDPRFPGMDRDTEVRFERDDAGEFQASDRLALNRIEKYFGTPRNLALQATSAQRPPEPRELLDTIAASHPPMDTRRFHTHYDFFLAADGSTSVLLTLGIRRSDPEPAWRVFARMSDGTSSFDLSNADSFRTSEAGSDVDGFRLYQGRVSLPPGIYGAFFGIQNSASGELYSLSERLTVPDFKEGVFSVSGITLAARLEPAEHPEAEPPFLVGRLLVVPKMEPVYYTGSEMAYYFQVYSPMKDPATGDARLDLTYEFQKAALLQKTGEPTFKAMGKPLLFENQSGLVHGYSFPLTGWPAGEFKLLITVKDRVSGKSSEGEARFSVR
jgi:GWxTD domain-containing protein